MLVYMGKIYVLYRKLYENRNDLSFHHDEMITKQVNKKGWKKTIP